MQNDFVKKRKSKNCHKSADILNERSHNKDLKGRILRIKHGYNPNSSSMGSIVFVLPAALLGITAGFGVVSGIIMSAFIKSADKKQASKSDSGEREEKSTE